MKLLWMTWFILNINHAIDTGKYQDISLEEVKEHIDAGDLLTYLRERLGDDVDFSAPQGEDAAVLNALLNDQLEMFSGRERRKQGIKNSGLCLLVAWANEIMHHEVGQQEVGLQDG